MTSTPAPASPTRLVVLDPRQFSLLNGIDKDTREAIRALPDGTYTAESELEGDGVTDEDVEDQAFRCPTSPHTPEMASATSGVWGFRRRCPGRDG